MHPMLNIAIRAARNAGKNLLKHQEKIVRESNVANQNNRSLTIQIADLVNKEIASAIQKSYPQHNINTSSSAQRNKEKKGPYLWQIRSIDNIDYFLRQSAPFSIAIAALRDHQYPEIALVYNPHSDELFIATNGDGHYSQLNGCRLHCRATEQLMGAQISLGPFNTMGSTTTAAPINHAQHYNKVINYLSEQGAILRCSGTPALDLAYLAAGKIDAIVAIGLSDIDLVVGELLVKCAHGAINKNVEPADYPMSGVLIAGHCKTINAILK